MIIRIILIILTIFIIYGLFILLGCLDNNIDDADYLIVLGHKLDNNNITKVLKYRLDKTCEYLKYFDSSIILSGGVTKNNTVSEASAMKQYLIEKGISDKNKVLEDKSTDTIENIKKSIKYIDKDSKVVIISSNYHIVRAKMICKLLGLKNVKGIGSYTPILELVKHLLIEEIFIFIHFFRIKKAR